MYWKVGLVPPLFLGLSEKFPNFKEALETRDSEMFVIIPMFAFLKSFNGEDQKLCCSFLPEISDPSHNLYKKYNLVKDQIFEVSQKLGRAKEKASDKENQIWNKRRSFQKGFKSLLNSAKFLSGNGLIKKRRKMDRELFSLSKGREKRNL